MKVFQIKWSKTESEWIAAKSQDELVAWYRKEFGVDPLQPSEHDTGADIIELTAEQCKGLYFKSDDYVEDENDEKDWDEDLISAEAVLSYPDRKPIYLGTNIPE